MKLRTILLFGLLLIGCQQVSVMEDDEVAVPQQTSTVQPQINDTWIESEITYIETLIGIEEMESARLALNDLLFSINGDVTDPLQQARINTMITLLEGIEVEGEVEEHHHSHSFTGADAVAIAMNRYEVDDDIIFMYHAQPSHFGTDQIGFYVALKSITLLESNEDSDGIVLLLFVSEDGSIVEIE